MSENNTLFLLTNWGLKRIDKIGIFESHMWNLNGEESNMEFLSLHKSKADRAYRGGKILNVRDATEKEVIEHQKLMAANNRGEMQLTGNRKVVVFQMYKGWHEVWPQAAKTNPMAYKGIGITATSN